MNGRIESTQLIISKTLITSTDCGTIAGTQMSFGSFAVRNPYREMLLTINRSKVRVGEIVGNVSLVGDGAISLLNNAIAVSGRTPSVETCGGGLLRFIGRIDMTAVTIANSPTIGTLPFSVNADAIVTVTTLLRAGTYSRSSLYISGTAFQVLDAAANTIATIFLDGVFVQINKNAS